MASGAHFHHTRAGKAHFFCPLCKQHQSTSTISRMGWKHFGQLLILTVATTFVFWPVCGVKGATFFFPYWAAFEFFYRLRKRQALICNNCGFDPFLYRQDVHKARKALKAHWQKRILEENLFAGKKLKNYETKSVTVTTQEPIEGAAGGEKRTEQSPPAN